MKLMIILASVQVYYPPIQTSLDRGLHHLPRHHHPHPGAAHPDHLVFLLPHINVEVILDSSKSSWNVMNDARESTEDLKNQLYHERTEGRRKLIAEKKKGSEGRDKNLSQKWKSILPGISANNSQKSKPDPEVCDILYKKKSMIILSSTLRQVNRAPFSPPSTRILQKEVATRMTSFPPTSNGRARKNKFLEKFRF